MASDFTIHRSLSAVSAPKSGIPTKGHIVKRQMALIEIDGDVSGNQANGTYHLMIPKELNKDGLLILDCYGIITEVINQDAAQTVITVRGNDGTTQVTHATITVVDADAASTLQDSNQTTRWESVADNASLKTTVERIIPADYDLEVALTTTGSDAGTVTGRVLVCVEFIAMPRRESEVQ